MFVIRKGEKVGGWAKEICGRGRSGEEGVQQSGWDGYHGIGDVKTVTLAYIADMSVSRIYAPSQSLEHKWDGA